MMSDPFVEYPPFVIRWDIRPGDIGRVVVLHGILYAQEYGLNYMLEGYVAKGLAEFTETYLTGKNRLWIAETDGSIAGSVGVVGRGEEAQFRWFIVHPTWRGKGLGKKLTEEAVTFSRHSGFKSIFLWTFSDLHVAIHVYKSAGFIKTEENTHQIWGQWLTEERYDLQL